MQHGRDRGGKERKLYLERQCLISCGKCPYHRVENATRRVPKPDRHKNIDRETIRGMELPEPDFIEDGIELED